MTNETLDPERRAVSVWIKYPPDEAADYFSHGYWTREAGIDSLPYVLVPRKQWREVAALLEIVGSHLECEITGKTYRCVTGYEPEEYCDTCKLRERTFRLRDRTREIEGTGHNP